MNRKFFLTILLSSFTWFAYPQTYNCYLTNINQVDARNLDFDIVLEWVGPDSVKLLFFQAGIIFNYAGIANGGTLTGIFVPGSADPSLPPVQQSPNWHINQSSKQIRMLNAIATPASIATFIPPAPGFRIGKFRMTNTVDFLPGSNPDFTWSTDPGTSTTTDTKIAIYETDTTVADVTDSALHFVDSTFLLEINHLENFDLEFFPNPAIDKAYVSFENDVNFDEIKIFALNGRQEEVSYRRNSIDKRVEINVVSLSPGIYFLVIIIDSKRIIQKFIRE